MTLLVVSMALESRIARSNNWVLGFGQPGRCDRSERRSARFLARSLARSFSLFSPLPRSSFPFYLLRSSFSLILRLAYSRSLARTVGRSEAAMTVHRTPMMSADGSCLDFQAAALPIMPFPCFPSASVKGVLRRRLSHYGTTGLDVRCYPTEKDNLGL